RTKGQNKGSQNKGSEQRVGSRAAGLQVEGLGDFAPVERRHRFVVVGDVEDAVGEGAGARLVQPDAVGQGRVLAGEAAQVAQLAAVEDVEDSQVGVLVGGDPVAAAVRAGPQRHAFGLGGEVLGRQVAAGVAAGHVVHAQGGARAQVLFGNQQPVVHRVAGDRLHH